MKHSCPILLLEFALQKEKQIIGLISSQFSGFVSCVELLLVHHKRLSANAEHRFFFSLFNFLISSLPSVLYL